MGQSSLVIESLSRRTRVPNNPSGVIPPPSMEGMGHQSSTVKTSYWLAP